MNYISAMSKDEREWIEKDPTLPLFRLACEKALKFNLIGTKAFKKGLFGYLPNFSQKRKEGRSDENIISRFQDCFKKVDPKVIEKAKSIVKNRNPDDFPCNGRFGIWALSSRNVPQKILKELLQILFRKKGLYATLRIFLNKYNGKPEGFGLATFSQLCYMIHEDLFPAINARTQSQISKKLKKKYGLQNDNYTRYITLARDVGRFVEHLGFPPKYRFSYFDRYTVKDKEARENIGYSAYNSFHKRLDNFLIPPSSSKPEKLSAEGEKYLSRHQAIERHQKNRAIYLNSVDKPYVCQVCGCNLVKKYELPETSSYIEIHHKMILSGGRYTPKLEHFVGMCPNCHVAVHRFITMYLKKKDKKKFDSINEALRVHEDFCSHCKKLKKL